MQQNKYVLELKITGAKTGVDMSSSIEWSHSTGLVAARELHAELDKIYISLCLQSNIESGMSQTTHPL
jgi:hypothetical protein